MRALPILVACLLLAGCFGQDDPADPTPTPTTTTPTPTPDPTPTPPTNGTPTPPTNATPTPPTNTTPTPPTDATPTPPTNGTPPPPVTIDIVNIAQGYSPASVTVPAGTNVTWVNEDPALPHTATADDGSFDTGTLQPGGAASIVLATPGTYPYHCTLHPNTMRATITVQ